MIKGTWDWAVHQMEKREKVTHKLRNDNIYIRENDTEFFSDATDDSAAMSTYDFIATDWEIVKENPYTSPLNIPLNTFVTVKDLTKKLLDCNMDWDVYVTDEKGVELHKVAICVRKVEKGLGALFG